MGFFELYVSVLSHGNKTSLQLILRNLSFFYYLCGARIENMVLFVSYFEFESGGGRTLRCSEIFAEQKNCFGNLLKEEIPSSSSQK